MYYTGCSYRGERTADGKRFDGQGVYTFANGDTYVGAFQDGRMHGPGTLFFAPDRGGGQYRGVWDAGRHVSGAFVFADGLVFGPDWAYCRPGDRRLWAEHLRDVLPVLPAASLLAGGAMCGCRWEMGGAVAPGVAAAARTAAAFADGQPRGLSDVPAEFWVDPARREAVVRVSSLPPPRFGGAESTARGEMHLAVRRLAPIASGGERLRAVEVVAAVRGASVGTIASQASTMAYGAETRPTSPAMGGHVAQRTEVGSGVAQKGHDGIEEQEEENVARVVDAVCVKEVHAFSETCTMTGRQSFMQQSEIAARSPNNSYGEEKEPIIIEGTPETVTPEPGVEIPEEVAIPPATVDPIEEEICDKTSNEAESPTTEITDADADADVAVVTGKITEGVVIPMRTYTEVDATGASTEDEAEASKTVGPDASPKVAIETESKDEEEASVRDEEAEKETVEEEDEEIDDAMTSATSPQNVRRPTTTIDLIPSRLGTSPSPMSPSPSPVQREFAEVGGEPLAQKPVSLQEIQSRSFEGIPHKTPSPNEMVQLESKNSLSTKLDEEDEEESL